MCPLFVFIKMQPDQIKIAPTEWEILEILWEHAPLSAAEIYEKLPPENEWNVKAVRAFLDRLLTKTAVKRRKIHGIFVFEPDIERSKCLKWESRSFLDRFFRGNPVSMISHFLQEENLSPEEIARLKKLLETVELEGK